MIISNLLAIFPIGLRVGRRFLPVSVAYHCAVGLQIANLLAISPDGIRNRIGDTNPTVATFLNCKHLILGFARQAALMLLVCRCCGRADSAPATSLYCSPGATLEAVQCRVYVLVHAYLLEYVF
jgi:hypothetical protein